MEYHDNEWGIPEFNGKKLFEILTLETFQSGLSWIIILKKRDNFRIAFDNFNPKAISRYDDKKLSELQIETLLEMHCKQSSFFLT